jgi:Tfp pilus assembly ATPase PilU
MYQYKLTLTNGKEYIVKNEISNITQFAKKYTTPNVITDFALNELYEENSIKFNTVLIRTDHIISIEYYTI